jgi:hypothetical protein
MGENGMWECTACGVDVEDDSLDVCWKCSTNRETGEKEDLRNKKIEDVQEKNV